MVLSLELHSSHNNNTNRVIEGVVLGSGDLVFKEVYVDFFLEFPFFFVVSNQNRGRKEARNQLRDQVHSNRCIDNYNPVNNDERDFVPSHSHDQRI